MNEIVPHTPETDHDSRRWTLARQEVLRRVFTTEEEERGRIARDLHNQAGQNLTACRLLLAQLTRGGQSDHKTTIAQLQELTTELAQDLHRIAVALRPTALDDLGLRAALESYVSDFADENRIEVSTHLRGLDARLAVVIETTVYRIVQEALRNAARHADARQVAVLVEAKEGVLTAIVEDDGKGFDPNDVRPNDGQRLSGIACMRERAALVDGEVKIESASGAGTTVYLRVPVGEATE